MPRRCTTSTWVTTTTAWCRPASGAPCAGRWSTWVWDHLPGGSRVPCLDHRLVELTAGLPARLKLQRATTKRILRESMKDVLPPSILTRPKVGFPVPVGSWFRGRWRGMVTELVLGERARRRGIFNPDVVRRLVGEHVSGRVEHMERLWALVNFELWLRRFVDGEEDVRMPQAPAVAHARVAG